MSSIARAQIKAAVEETLPDSIRVLEYSKEIDPPRRTTAMVRVDELVPLPQAPLSARVIRATLVVVATRNESQPADEELEDAVDLILWSIDNSPTNLVWTTASRTTWAQSDGNEYPGFEIKLELGLHTTDPTQEQQP